MEAFWVSTLVVAVGEIGDKTQLLALMLASRWRAPVPILLGILVATVANHVLAGALGVSLTHLIGPVALRWIVGLSFLALAAWALVPDRADDAEAQRAPGRWGAFGATVVCFFLAEMGDKTQLATIALAAEYQRLVAVVVGSTLGLVLANLPVVLLGSIAAHRISLRAVRLVAAALFAGLGILTLASGLGAG
jgi:putative Ca2+/H+ antiporter (TMEM165/GDT1 family)